MLGKHISACEDSLTASVFSHLFHLPTELWWRIFRNACYTGALPVDPGEPLQIDPWPRWSAKGTDNSVYVEPDLFLRFECLDVIVEAKRWDEGMQREDQWRNQMKSYLAQFAPEIRKEDVRLIALGGLWTTGDKEMEVSTEVFSNEDKSEVKTERQQFRVHMCRWRGVLDECLRMKMELDRMAYPTSQSRAHRRILDDVIALFSCHGFQTGIWFGDAASALQKYFSHMHDAGEVFRSVSLNVR